MTYENETASFAAMKRDLDDVVGRSIGLKNRPVSGAVIGGKSAQLTRQTLPQDVHETCGQASNLVARIMDMADRLCGPVPSAGDTGSEVNAPVVGEFGQMRERLSATREGLASASAALDRIERELL